MYNKARKQVLYQMKKSGKMPKPSTTDKYQLKDEEIKECMEEVVLCQPSERVFYKKGGYWLCPCNKRYDRCLNPECKILGAQLGLKVGRAMCEHSRRRSECKECGGSQICEHSRIRSECKECGGSQICEHSRRRSECKECGGSQICEHSRIRSTCKECGGSQICEHSRRRSECKECGGGHICEHSRWRSRCKECGGSQICEHSRLRSECKICDPQGHLINLRRSRRNRVTKSPNPTHTLDDLCMTTKEWMKYLHKTFEDRYGRPITDNDDVHIDEIIPCSAWNLPDDNKYCWHYLNSQWLLAEDNLSKSDSYQEKDKVAMIERIQSSLYTSSSEMG